MAPDDGLHQVAGSALRPVGPAAGREAGDAGSTSQKLSHSVGNPPPTGLVAFLFTDIEGSTRLWERDPAAMRRALDRHNALLDEAIAAHRGVHFKTIGDALQAAFPDASAAVAAVVTAQRALATEAWPETGPLRVRMALHVGEASPTPGSGPGSRPDYLAPALNRLARLLASGYGGQTLLTDVARNLASSALPAGVTLRDLGRHRLRDLLEAELVWQLVIPGLPDSFPPLKTLERHPTNLPPQPTAMVGRAALLAALLPIVTDPATRLLTLTGPGGVGKTRLAVQLAADALEAFPDGAFFVDLANTTDPAAVLPLVAAVLGVREGSGLSLSEATIALLNPKRLLLVLDNLEQMRPTVDLGREVTALLAGAPSLTILATSRAPMRIRSEREWPLDPLPVPDPSRPLPPTVLAENPAVALFLDRVQAAKPTFALSAANAPAVAAIVHRLDGLPLALELAAARLRALSPSQLRDRLGDQLDLLFSPSGDRPDRQQTLRATICWSHNLLEPDQRAVFRRLGVFAGGFTLEVAEAVAASGGDTEPLPDVLAGVEELVVENLLRAEETAEGEMRYRMLETIRAYALERLTESGEEQTVRDAHLGYFATWMGEADRAFVGPDSATWLERSETEHDNLRAALTWGLEHDPTGMGYTLLWSAWRFWQIRGHLSEGREWLNRGLAHLARGADLERANLLEGIGQLATAQGDLEVAEQAMAESVALFRATGARRGTATALNALGTVADLSGNLERARVLYEEGLAIAQEIGDRGVESPLLANLGLVAAAQGDLATARSLLSQSLALKEASGDRRGMPSTLTNLAVIAVDEGDLAAATAYLEQSLTIDRELGNRSGVADDLGNLGAIAAMQGEPLQAARWHHEALNARRDLGDWLSIAYSLETIASTAGGVGFPVEAARLHGAAERLREDLGAPLPTIERDRYAEGLAPIRAALAAEGFAAAWEAGRSLPRSAAVDEALALAHQVAQADKVSSPTRGAAVPAATPR